MVHRIYSEKKKEFANEARALLSDARQLLGIKGLTELRVLNRYDADNIEDELFEHAKTTVFSEPQVDELIETPDLSGARVFAVEYLPGQFDQRADSAAQCIQIISQKQKPIIRSARVFALYGDITDDEFDTFKKYVINPVEAREASLELPESLAANYTIPTEVETIKGFISFTKDELADFIKKRGLAMDEADIEFCQKYFIEEQRDPTITEIKMIDTYWSDHCRHTTFNTIIDKVNFTDPVLEKAYQHYLDTRKELGRTKPICLMDIATLAVKYLRQNGMLDKLDESEEINACTVKIEIEADGVKEPWLLLFKNETHNHPTEIEPFGGAATCIGGAIRDPLSGRSYVYGAMRVTGAADPRRPISETLPGKLPQRKIVTGAAAGYSSYGNQIGLATGIVDEIYHPGYEAKRMEIGAVIAATPAENVRRERPEPGDIVIMLGGSTGRDGIGGATGSSKAHTAHSVEDCGAEVQKGNAPEERKLQRLFRNKEASQMIKRCNDFGAGGVSVAIGELADGLEIDLDKVPKKYDGLDGTELAISESQERMAVVIAKEDEERFLKIARSENLQAVKLADVIAEPRLRMHWQGKTIVDVARSFLDSNGAEKHIVIDAAAPALKDKEIPASFESGAMAVASDINCASKRGLCERFDSTIGAGTVTMPFGGTYQLTPEQAMVQKISVEKKHTDDCSLMAFGYDPFISEQSPYHGAYLAVIESVCKLVASGAEYKDVYLSLQEYFEKPMHDSKRWGKPLAALLGAFDAQMAMGIGAIGGKDSMSGSFENIDVPPTLVSFAVTTDKCENIISAEFKKAGSVVKIIRPAVNENGLPDAVSLKNIFKEINSRIKSGQIISAYTPGIGGAFESVMKMAMGNMIGFDFDDALTLSDIFGYAYGSFIVELKDDEDFGITLGRTTDKKEISYKGESLGFDKLFAAYEDALESVYPSRVKTEEGKTENFSYSGAPAAAFVTKTAKPKVLIPVFPGTNCEYDSAKVMRDAGAEAEIFVINNLTAESVAQSVEEFAKKTDESQMIFIPGGFSGGDEPDGSGKFITAFFRNAAVKDAVTNMLDVRGGLMLGICNGFQALIKLGLVPYGKIIDTDENCPTLSFNTIARHQSRIVRTRIASVKSPWLSHCKVGEIYNVPISHGEGRFIASEALIRELAANGQIVTQYADLSGNATMDIMFNPNGSMYSIEGICSPDGRVFGKMGHSERKANWLYKNVPGKYDMMMFESAVEFFK